MWLFAMLACGTIGDLEAQMEAMQQDLEDLEEQNQELADENDAQAEEIEDLEDQLAALEDSGGSDTGDGEEGIAPSVVYSESSTKLSDGNYDFVVGWAVDGDYEAIRTTIANNYKQDERQTTEDACGEISFSTTTAYNYVIVEIWTATSYQCWSTYVTPTPSCIQMVRIESVTCDS